MRDLNGFKVVAEAICYMEEREVNLIYHSKGARGCQCKVFNRRQFLKEIIHENFFS